MIPELQEVAIVAFSCKQNQSTAEIENVTASITEIIWWHGKGGESQSTNEVLASWQF